MANKDYFKIINEALISYNTRLILWAFAFFWGEDGCIRVTHQHIPSPKIRAI